MNYKVCTKCNENLPATKEYFNKMQRGKYGFRSQCIKCIAEYSKSRYVSIPKKIEKACGRCNEVFPLTKEYFYTKTTKAGTIINGKALSVDSTSFRSVCKKCHTKQGFERRRSKLMVKYNVSSQEELNEVIYMIRRRSGLLGNHASLCVAYKKRKYTYPLDVSLTEMARLRKIYAKGYNPETYDTEWKKRWLGKMKSLRKYDYDTDSDVVPKNLIQKMQSEIMTDAFIANRLGFKLEDVSQDIIELKRKQLKFYRDVKNKINKSSNY